MTLGYAIGFIAAGLMLASYLMKSMLPLRIVALVACVFFVLYGWMEAAWPSLALYAALIPINIKKVLEIKRLLRAVENANHDTPLAQWLLPHMTRRQARAGEMLWRAGDPADEMVYLDQGQLCLVEYEELLEPGALVGEIGLLSPDRRRTGTIRCQTDCTLYTMSGDAMAQLYYKNPKLGFHVMRLVVARLQHDLQLRAAREQAADAGPAAVATASPTPASTGTPAA